MAAVSSYRDRTAEFRSLFATPKKIDSDIGEGSFSISQLNGFDQSPPKPSPGQSHSSRSEFNKKASRIGLGIYEASQKISRLAKLAKRSSMFDDPTLEIQDLTALIKNDITALNSAVSDLQMLQYIEIADGDYSHDRVTHSSAVCADLKNRLMGAAKQFQEVLTSRTESIKAHETRKQIFSGSATRQNTFQNHMKPTAEPPPWSSSSNSAPGDLQLAIPSNGVQVGSQLRRRIGIENSPSQHMEMAMLQHVAPLQEEYLQGRASALRNVESTITELGGIFTNLATMVAQQGELAIRIDDNMDQSLANVDGAQTALAKHLKNISSNRSLLIKIFAVLIFCLVVFIVFVA